jgi:hypothetical protein
MERFRGDGRRDPVGEREEDTGKRFEGFGGGNAGRSGRATAASGSGTPASARGRGEARPRGKGGGRGSLPHRGKPTVLGRRLKAARRWRGGDPRLAATAVLGARVCVNGARRRLRRNPREAAGLYRAATRRPGERARGGGGHGGAVELGLELESGSVARKGMPLTGGVALSAAARERAGR